MTYSLDMLHLSKLSRRLHDSLWFMLTPFVLGFGGVLVGAGINLPLGLAMIFAASFMGMFVSELITFR